MNADKKKKKKKCRHTFSYCLEYAFSFLDDNVDEECE